MTFDEALKIYDDPDVEDLIETWEVVDVIEQLRKEYAPTVEMPDFAVNRLSEMVQTFGEYWGAGAEEYMDPETKGIEVEDTFVTFEQLKALMHPETIKVVDE